MRGCRVAADEATTEAAGEVEELRALVGQLRTHLDARGRSGLQGVVMTKTARAVVAAAPVAVAPIAVAVAAPRPIESVHVDEREETAEVAGEKARTGKAGL